MSDFKYCLTPEVVYDNPKILSYVPEDMEVVDFRPVKSGDWFLTKTIRPSVEECETDDWADFSTPRLILRKKREVIDDTKLTFISVKNVYGASVDIPEGYKFVDFRIPGYKETYITTALLVAENGSKFFTSPRIIVTKA